MNHRVPQQGSDTWQSVRPFISMPDGKASKRRAIAPKRKGKSKNKNDAVRNKKVSINRLEIEISRKTG